MRMYKPVMSVALAFGMAGCATAGMSAGDSVARLEQQQKSSPQSVASNRSLGIAYYKAERYTDAQSTLVKAQKLDPKDGTTALYLGLTDEALGDLSGARAAYSSYIEFGRTSRVRGQLESHLAALTRKELAADAKTAVAQEATISTQAGDPHTVAVMPLRFSGSDSTLKPLERGFADLLTTDLSRSAQLKLVERARMQALLDEIKVQQSGATDATSNVRAGKMLRAGRVVQGSLNQLNGETINVAAAVVDVPTSKINGVANQSDQLDQIFNLEKRLALDIFTQMGVTLTVAERNQIEQRPTRNLAAFLAYSRGLTAQDEGRYDDAGRFFNEAVRLDPGFNAAQQKGQESRAAAAGSAVTAATVETSLKGTSEGAVVQAATQGTVSSGTTASSGSGLGNTAQNTAGDLNPSASGAATGGVSTSSSGSTPSQKDPVAAGTGTDNLSPKAQVTITITRPKVP